jgi:CheY-like chemotaxis protein
MRERLRSQAVADTRILLVEDSDDVRALMTLLLEGEG